MKKPVKRGDVKNRLGVHTSIAGGISKAIERAASLGCNTMQIFSHSPRQWAETVIPAKEIVRFKQLRSDHDIAPVFIHASYLINLASLNRSILARSIPFLTYELENADSIGAEYLVLHTGSASGDIEKKARERAVRSLLRSLSSGKYKTRILLENTAGEKGDITSSVRNLADIIDACHDKGIGGICIDTCHAFASGYDLGTAEGVDSLLCEIDKYIGLASLRLLHLNDSKKPYGSCVDRHEHIGKGYIGLKGFRNLLSDPRIKGVPLILETPKKGDIDDRRNLLEIKRLLG